jgi:hypothetical protein
LSFFELDIIIYNNQIFIFILLLNKSFALGLGYLRYLGAVGVRLGNGQPTEPKGKYYQKDSFESLRGLHGGVYLLSI